MVGALSRRRWFGLSIILAALSVTVLAFAWHLVIGVVGALLVGVGAGMAFLSGTTLLGTEVTDDVRGRVFAFIQTGTQVTLLLTISLSSFVVGFGGSRRHSRLHRLDDPAAAARRRCVRHRRRHRRAPPDGR